MRYSQDRYADIMYLSKPRLKRKMETAHRAKQFAPFAALKGFEEAVEDTAIVCENHWNYEKTEIGIS